jgi:aminobenzoyl-glutamate utilization protein B
VDGTANPLPNTALEKVIFRNLQEVPLPEYSAEEKEYAAKLRKTWEGKETFPGLGALADKNIAAEVKEFTKNGTLDLNSFVYPFYSGDEFTPGSTDVGDVSWLTPTVQFNAVTWPAGSPGHSWQTVSCGRTSIGDKGLLYAAKVLAGTAADLFAETGLLKEAKAEFEERTKDEKYLCPIEEDAVPYVIG